MLVLAIGQLSPVYAVDRIVETILERPSAWSSTSR
ncbi:hypothetical protein BC477_15360 [Clavibacter michiganensis subsp. michiganensis]|uniref:Uncharacterized protein n=1 Tax=Clavibacter michiganensis subsp. michiganensis TaxID=33013 RepID=A0A251XCN9_CLAMM|nr:hypothetical protein BC477_15360 [Clavibacter michiganensis subsp. michiganensis]OUD99781.1 hypothetical protein CMMCAS07_20115 [Clavibacter michiganensis subsp. michiganensis]